MARLDLSKLSYAQLLDLQKDVAEALAEKRAESASATKEKIRALAEQAGFKLDEVLGGARTRRGPAQIKYRNPNNAEETWAGRGRRPAWLITALKKNGGKLAPFEV